MANEFVPQVVGLFEGLERPRDPVLTDQPVGGDIDQFIIALEHVPALLTVEPVAVVFAKVIIELAPELQATVSVAVNLAFGF